jgi:hypothetical protein
LYVDIAAAAVCDVEVAVEVAASYIDYYDISDDELSNTYID